MNTNHEYRRDDISTLERARASLSKQQTCHGTQQDFSLIPRPHQLFVACSMEKRGESGIFSHVSMT